MIRKDFFLRIGGFDERLDFVEDWEFGVRVFKNGRVKYVQDRWVECEC
jgi:GT2 family glycosyltransferase